MQIEYEGTVYHITSRGNAQADILFTDADWRAFLDTLAETIDRFGCLCHAFCLMTNHYHLLVETPDANLSRGMRCVNGVYTQWINHQHNRTGQIFEGRFKSVFIEKESHLLEIARYVVLNPVRAKAAHSARAWHWSSYRATAGQEPIPDSPTVGWILAQFDSNPSRAVQACRSFVRDGLGIDVSQDLWNGNLLGPDTFTAKLAPFLKVYAESSEIRRRERFAGRPTLEALFSGVHTKVARNQGIYRAAHDCG